MAPLVLSDDAAFYAWAAATWALLASIAAAIATGWARGRRFRVEDLFTRFRVVAMLVCALLSQISLRLYAVRVVIPETRRWRVGRDAVGVEAAVEGVLSYNPYVWPVSCCLFCLGFLMNFIFAGAGGRRAPPPPRAASAVSGKKAGGGRVPLAELAVFLALLWVCVYSFPVAVLSYYMAATANGKEAAAT